VSFTNAAAIAAPLTGFSSATGGTVVATDSIVAAIGRLENRVAVDDAKTGYSNATTIASTLTGFSSATGGAVTAADSILVGMGRLQNRTPTVALSATAPVVYTSATGVISMGAASSGVNGYLTGTDWDTFNNKVSSSGTVTGINGHIATWNNVGQIIDGGVAATRTITALTGEVTA